MIKLASRRARLYCGAATAFALPLAFLPAAAQAQSAPQQEEAAVVDEIVVTALRRETRLQDTPISITAVTGQALENMGASTVQDIVSSVPGLNLTEGQTGQRRISIRGVQSAGESTVGLYLGDTPVTGPNSATSDPSSITPDLNMFDVSRVGRVDVLIDAAEMTERRAAFEAAGGYRCPPSQTPWQEMQRAMVGELETGAVLEPAVGYHRIIDRFGNPRDNH